MYMHFKVLTLYNPPERISFNFCFVETSQGVVRNTTRTLQHPIGGHYIAIISFSARKCDQIEKLFFGLKFSDRNFFDQYFRPKFYTDIWRNGIFAPTFVKSTLLVRNFLSYFRGRNLESSKSELMIFQKFYQ